MSPSTEFPIWAFHAINATSCAITVADATQADFPLIYVNQTFETLTGYTTAEVLGKNCRFLQGTDSKQPNLLIVRQALNAGKEIQVTLKNYRKDGSLFWNELHLIPVFNELQQLQYYVGIQTDVTAQKDFLVNRQSQTLLFHQCLDAISAGILLVDRAGQIVYANQATHLLRGKTLESDIPIHSLANECPIKIAGTEQAYPIEKMPLTLALSGQSVTVDDMEVQRDQQRILLQGSGCPIRDVYGKVTHAIATFSDITAFKNQQNQLLEEVALHQALLNSAIDAIITINCYGIIQSVNPATLRIFGYAREELLGKNIKMLVPEPHHSQHDTYIKHYLKTGRAKIIGLGREVQGLRKNGTLFPMELAVTEVKLPHTHLFKGIVRDISQRKEVETKLKKSEEYAISLLSQFKKAGCIILGANRCIEFLSQSCEQFNLSELQIGQPWEKALLCDAESKQKLARLLNAPVTERQRITLHWQCHAQADCWVECDVRDDPRDTTLRILILYDVSENYQLRQTIELSRYGKMLGESQPMRELYRLINDVAQGIWSVLIEGETGVGKELVAHSIHAASSRKNEPFVTVNSAGLSETLLASQLFGHKKGSFTGAVANQEGFFEAAHGGTLFLDEIGDLPLNMQASLLRVLQEKEITRVGENQPRKVDVRIITATHKDLATEVREGRFREDLLYRLRVARLRIPALRERKDDIPLLVESFLKHGYHISGRTQAKFSPEALRCLCNYEWPGNVRELKACVDYAVIHCHRDFIYPEDLPPEIARAFRISVEETDNMTRKEETDNLPNEDETAQIVAALQKTAGNRLQAAQLLGVSRATFYRRLRELGISLAELDEQITHSRRMPFKK